MSDLKPVDLLAAGRPRNGQTYNPLLHEVFKESGKTNPTIAYVGAASADNKAFFLMMAALAKGAGAGKIKHVILSSTRADIKKLKTPWNVPTLFILAVGMSSGGCRYCKRKI